MRFWVLYVQVCIPYPRFVLMHGLIAWLWLLMESRMPIDDCMHVGCAQCNTVVVAGGTTAVNHTELVHLDMPMIEVRRSKVLRMYASMQRMMGCLYLYSSCILYKY